jgi:hypothetical protein
MATRTPHDRLPRLIGFLMENMSADDRRLANRVWMALMPPEVFGRVKQIVKDSITSGDWSDLTKRVSELA